LKLKIPKNYLVKSLKICKFEQSFKLSNFFYDFQKTNNFSLRGSEFAFQKGQRIAVVGPSGSGKSTLLEILAGIRQIEVGTFLVDDIEIMPSMVKSWRNHIDYIPQKSFIPDQSIDHIITGDVDDKKIDPNELSRIKDICLIDFDDRKSSKTSYAGARNTFSGGQIQRLALARSLFSKREVLILDEATNALDKHKETLIFENLFKYEPQKTIIASIHNHEMLHEFDVVYCVQAGILRIYKDIS